jgi:ABC-type branched-subunit amino acid transport system substrate-binding protein
MKSFKLFILALGLFSLNVAAANFNPINPTDELRIEMAELIGSSYMDNMQADELGAEVLFTINKNKEIIILSVDSDNASIESYLKNKLNYKKVNHRPGNPGEIYLLPVKMVKQL